MMEGLRDLFVRQYALVQDAFQKNDEKFFPRLPNDSPFSCRIRKISSIAASVFLAIALIPALIGGLFSKASEPSPLYQVRAASFSSLFDQLEQLKASKRPLECLRIDYEGQEPFEEGERVWAIVNSIKPNVFHCSGFEMDEKGGELSPGSLFYYCKTEVREEENAVLFTFERRAKRSFVVLPKDFPSVLKAIKELAENKTRVVCLFFTEYVPDIGREEMQPYLDVIRPVMEGLIPSSELPDTIEARLHSLYAADLFV